MSAANSNPNKALSSAAAAAALRARPHTPTNVAEVQTKRTARRSASVSSSGSARFANGHGQLERRGSTSSMTERTFRSPSPHRPSATTTQEEQPPVPRIPDSHKSPVRNARTAGVGMQNFRTASQKMAEEPPSWYVQPSGDTSNVRRSDSIMANSAPPRQPDTVPSQPIRSDSRSSVNFSYPTAFRPQSPPASPTLASSSPNRGSLHKTRAETNQQLVYDPNSRRMVPKAQAGESNVNQVKQVAEKSSRRRDGTLRREGSQLAKGTVARARGTMVDEDRCLREISRQEQPVAEAVPNAEEHPIEHMTGVGTTAPIETPEHRSPSPSPDPRMAAIQEAPPLTRQSDEHEQDVLPDSQLTQDPASSVQDKPPIHGEGNTKEFRQTELSQAVRDVLDSMPTRQVLPNSSSPSKSNQKTEKHESTQEGRSIVSAEGPKLRDIQDEPKVIVADNKTIVGLAAENSSLKRSSSNSPARQARFAPVPAEQLAVRHTPLPRSASPIKSAMKQPSPILRGTSPPDNMSDPSRSSTVSPDRKEEPFVSRKKSVRVSFDDDPVVVGDTAASAEGDTPVTQSPSGAKRAWFSNIGRSKKKDFTLDDDEIMKPRPALPSFGSIREKKNRESGERPLVRPLEPVYSPAASSPELRPQSSSTLNDSEITEESALGQSSDHAIGGLLIQDQTSRNAANISRFREPLPPVVTSIEGSGYSSDSIPDSDHEDHSEASERVGIPSISSNIADTHQATPDRSDSNQGTSTATDTQNRNHEAPETPTTPSKNIPEISVIHPSPMSMDHGSNANDSTTPQFFDVPGGFPDYSSDLSTSSQVEAPKEATNIAIFEPTATTVESSQAKHLPQTTLQAATPVESFPNEDESDESVYSDAYEDISDLENSGFMSLDAIVEGPYNGESKQQTSPVSKNSPKPATTNESARNATSDANLPNQSESISPQNSNDWEQAKAFWRSLTAEKRRQLELEAAEEAGVDGDREEVSQPIRRNSNRRKSSELTQSPIESSPAQAHTVQSESRMRMSLRDGQATKTAGTQPQTGMRKSMRSNGGTQGLSKPSARQAGPNKTVAPNPLPPTQREAANVGARSSTQPVPSGGITTQVKPSLQRRGSDASDSSFKRSRPSPSGGFGFRKTMRQPSPSQPRRESTGGSGRFSLRSLSPTGSTTRARSNASFTTSSPGAMKRTLRSNSESSHEGKRSSVHFPLFSRTAKSASRSPKYHSRFEDSSDEDETALPNFRSRLNDSSDEEGGQPSPTRESKALGKTTLRSSATASSLSRPAPVPELDEDSPDLPDSDDDVMPSPLRTPQSRMTTSQTANRLGAERRGSGAIGTSTLGRSRSGRGGFTPSLSSPTLPTKDKRGSILGRLRLNRKGDQGGKIHRAELVDSAARRDTKLERNQGQLKNLRNEQASSPKLQKRSSIPRQEGGGGGGALQRPSSAGNLLGRASTASNGNVERPHLEGKRSLSLNLGTNSIQNTNPPIHSHNESHFHELESASVDHPGGVIKKKKFGALRRMLKLYD